TCRRSPCAAPSAPTGRHSRSSRMRPGRCRAPTRRPYSSSCTSSRRRSSMLYDLRRADARIKWLVTCLLATFGLSYVFGALMVVVGLSLPRGRAFGLITLLFAAPWLDFAGMWLTKFASPRFAIVTLIGGWAMGAGYLVVAALAVQQMWFSRERS